MSGAKVPHDEVWPVYERLIDFEAVMPFNFKCRASVVAGGNPENTAPAVDPENAPLTLQQHALASAMSAVILSILRPYTDQATAFSALLRRCNMMIATSLSLFSVMPEVAKTHWFMRYYATIAAVTLTSVAITAPKSPLARATMIQVQAVCDLLQNLGDPAFVLLDHLRQLAIANVYGAPQARLVLEIGEKSRGRKGVGPWTSVFGIPSRTKSSPGDAAFDALRAAWPADCGHDRTGIDWPTIAKSLAIDLV